MFVFRFAIYFCLSYLVLCLPLGGKTLFEHLYQATSPMTNRVLEGAEDDNNFGGGPYAGPVLAAILRAWKEKQDRTSAQPVNLSVQ